MADQNPLQVQKCYKCGKSTDIECYRCHKPICSNHTFWIHHHFYCEPCFYRERKIGIIKAWGGIVALILIGVISILVITNS